LPATGRSNLDAQKFEPLIFNLSRLHLGVRKILLTKPLTCQAADNPNVCQNCGPRKSGACQPMFFFLLLKGKGRICLVQFGRGLSKLSLRRGRNRAVHISSASQQLGKQKEDLGWLVGWLGVSFDVIVSISSLK
jgi:hypothetical protein